MSLLAIAASCSFPDYRASEVATPPDSPCAPNPCLQGGRCFESGEEHTCVCPQGFQGRDCEIALTFCDPNPCQNGGVCIDSLMGASCDCEVGFSGDRCQTNDDDCAPNPCQNGGTCEDAVNAYSCQCLAGFNGDTCSGAVEGTCAEILAGTPGSPSGVYLVDPDGPYQGAPPISVYCDMVTNGGGYTRVGQEQAGSAGTFKFLGLESGSAADVASGSGNGFFGPRFAGRYRDVRITWSGAKSGFIAFHTDTELFVNDVQPALGVSNFESSDAALLGWVGAAGGAVFCRASRSPDLRPGDSSWGLKPLDDTQHECGCSGTTWGGRGAFYGGHPNPTSCGSYGGGWAAAQDAGSPKAGIVDLTSEIWIR